MWCIFNVRYAVVASPCFPTGRKSCRTFFYLHTVIRSRETFDILWWVLRQIPFTACILSRDPSKGLRPVYQSWSTKHKSVSLLADAFLSYSWHKSTCIFCFFDIYLTLYRKHIVICEIQEEKLNFFSVKEIKALVIFEL